MGRVLEQLRGFGRIYEGDTPLGNARYEVTVYQRTYTVRTFGTRVVDGPKEVRGVIEPEASLSIAELMNRGAELTLRMDDGRRWDFVFLDARGIAANRSQAGLYAA
jgi:hypothetical protein